MRPWKFPLRERASLDEAFAAAGGYNGKGGLGEEDGHPSSFCKVLRRVDGESRTFRVRIDTDRKTGVITTRGERFLLKDGDVILMPQVIF